MIGQRGEPDENGWLNRKLNPGEYVKVAPTANADGTPLTEEQRAKWWNKPYWIACAPNGHACNLANHQVTEHDDGTITVSPSILISTSYDQGKTMVQLWHGYLERGVWRAC